MRRRPSAWAAALVLPVSLPAELAATSTGATNQPIVGVDLSYVNEMEDCGATYTDGNLVDPFAILASRGANLVRARLWHDPEWTDYSTVDDVIRTFQRGRANGMRTLLDFHYSDEWADPSRQTAPAAWSAITDVDQLAAALGSYTSATLQRFDEAGVLPDMVQIGNEINSGLVNGATGLEWDHVQPLLTAGIDAVRSVAEATDQPIEVLLHVAQPENALEWFKRAADLGLTDFDVIGLSYYPQWSSFTPAELGSAVQSLQSAYDKDVLVVETGYPWTRDDAGDSADNVLDQSLRVYDVSPTGQAGFMTDLTSIVVANGGLGTVYWEPAWLSTACRTRWGQGSHWENATLFDFDGALHAGADYLAGEYPALAIPDAAPVVAGDRTGDVDDPVADLVELTAAHDGALAISVTLAGDLRRWPGSVIVAFDIDEGGGGDGGRRPYDFADDDRPELLLESEWNDEPGVGYVSTSASVWRDDAWEDGTFTGRVEIAPGADQGSTVTWLLPAGAVDTTTGLTAMSAHRGRAGALADVVDPATPDDAVVMTVEVGTS